MKIIFFSLPGFHWTKSPNKINMKWQFFYCGVFFKWNTSITSSWRTKHYFTIILTLLSVSCILSHNSHLFLYLNGINLCKEHLDMFWNIWNLILWREAWKKQWSCSGDSKYGAFIFGQSEQQFKIRDPFVVLYLVIGWVQWYDDEASHDLK